MPPPPPVGTLVQSFANKTSAAKMTPEGTNSTSYQDPTSDHGVNSATNSPNHHPNLSGAVSGCEDWKRAITSMVPTRPIRSQQRLLLAPSSSGSTSTYVGNRMITDSRCRGCGAVACGGDNAVAVQALSGPGNGSVLTRCGKGACDRKMVLSRRWNKNSSLSKIDAR